MIKTSTLANLIMQNTLADKPQREDAPECFACGRPYTYRGPNGDDSGRFCSARCREAYDAGFPQYAPPKIAYSLPRGRHGFLIGCAHCRKQFDSKGLRCCSVECERAYRNKQELDAELANDPFRVVKRKCAACGGDIPNWRNGKRVSKATKFCSPRCQRQGVQNAVLAPTTKNPDSGGETAKKCPSNGLRRKGDAAPSASAEQPA